MDETPLTLTAVAFATIIILISITILFTRERVSFRDSPEYTLCIEAGGVPKPNYNSTLLDDCIFKKE